MSHNILITGASGYLGGTLLNRLKTADLPTYSNLYALVRTDAQSEGVKQYGAQALAINAYDETAVREAVLGHEIDIIFVLHDAFKAESQVNFIKALAELKKRTGKEVHLLHVCRKFLNLRC